MRLTLNEIFGVLASYSLVESESNIGCCELFSWSLSQLFAALSSTLSLVQSSAYLILNRLQQNGALQKYRYVRFVFHYLVTFVTALFVQLIDTSDVIRYRQNNAVTLACIFHFGILQGRNQIRSPPPCRVVMTRVQIF